MTSRVLVVSERAPLHPRDGGDGITVISHALVQLDDDDIDVTCVWPANADQAVDGTTLARRRGALKVLARFGRYTSGSLTATSPANRRRVAELASTSDAVLFIGPTSFLLARGLHHPRLLFHCIDPFSLVHGEARTGGFLERSRNHLEAWRFRNLERFAAARGTVAVISDDDASRLSAALGTPVTATRLGYEGRLTTSPPERDVDLCFAGKLGWQPNHDSALHILDTLLPPIRREVPGATLRLIGASPAPELVARNGDGVEVLADVADVVACASRCRVALMPGGFGWGIRSSVLNVLAAGTPVVASPRSACGLPRSAAVRIVDTDEAMVAAAVEILRDDELRASMSHAASELMADWPTWVEFARRLVRSVLEAPARSPETS